MGGFHRPVLPVTQNQPSMRVCLAQIAPNVTAPAIGMRPLITPVVAEEIAPITNMPLAPNAIRSTIRLQLAPLAMKELPEVGNSSKRIGHPIQGG
jgi:hypothetical protein